MDQSLFFFFNQTMASPALDFLMGLISHKWYFAAPLLIALLLVLIRRFAASAITLWLIIILCIGMGDGIGNMLKHVFEKPRPCQELTGKVRLVTQPFVYKCSKTSRGMPSNHSLNYFLLAVMFGVLFGSWRWGMALALLASSVAISRMYLGMHYPSQVLAGAAIGSLLGFIFSLIVIRSTWYQRIRLNHPLQ